MLMARADSAAVVENMVIATCSLISESPVSIYINHEHNVALTERSRVHKPPKGRVPGGKTRIEWPRDNLFQNDAQEV